MAVNDILVFKRTVTVQKQGSLSEQTISSAVWLEDIDANLVLRNSTNGFYTYDVVINGREAAPGLEILKFIITSSQDDKADVTGVLIGAVGVNETLIANDTVRTDSVNNFLSTHTLSVYANETPP